MLLTIHEDINFLLTSKFLVEDEFDNKYELSIDSFKTSLRANDGKLINLEPKTFYKEDFAKYKFIERKSK